MATLTVRDDPADWFSLGTPAWGELGRMDLILARKDPPFDDQFLYDTHVLDRAAQAGALVLNRPQGLRDANEKLFARIRGSKMGITKCFNG
jgi:glutathione synthase